VRTGSERNAEGDTHPGEDILSLAFEQALTGNELSRVEQRLGNCWNCRARPEEMNRGILAFIDYRENRYLPSIPVPTGDFPDFGPAFGVWNPRLLQRWNWCIVANAALRSDLSNLVVASKLTDRILASASQLFADDHRATWNLPERLTGAIPTGR
jgi:hypothetical protein